MFSDLDKYETRDHFFFDRDEPLGEVCNAPKDSSGVYVVYELAKGKIRLVYIGSSGKMQSNGRMKHRKGGLWDRIANGKQFDKPRRISWDKKLANEGIDALDVYWYDTWSDNEIPATVEGMMIQRFYEAYGMLPKWNDEY
jgi:hypothetical protein